MLVGVLERYSQSKVEYSVLYIVLLVGLGAYFIFGGSLLPVCLWSGIFNENDDFAAPLGECALRCRLF